VADDLGNGKPSKWWSLVDGALFGLGVGVIASIFAPQIPPTWSLTFGVIVIVLGIFRWGKFRVLSFVLSAVVAAMVFGAWKIIPKQDPPATKKDVQELFKDQLGKPDQSPRDASIDDKPISRTELAKMLQQYKKSQPSSSDQLETMAPTLVAEMSTWSEAWDLADRKIEAEKATGLSKPSMSKEDTEGFQKYIAQEKDALNRQYIALVFPTMEQTNSLRLLLLSRYGSFDSSKDAPVGVIFTRVLSKQTINWLEMQSAANYTRDLWAKAQKVKAQTH
jgi:hypothetical protein